MAGKPDRRTFTRQSVATLEQALSLVADDLEPLARLIDDLPESEARARLAAHLDFLRTYYGALSKSLPLSGWSKLPAGRRPKDHDLQEIWDALRDALRDWFREHTSAPSLEDIGERWKPEQISGKTVSKRVRQLGFEWPLYRRIYMNELSSRRGKRPIISATN